MNFHVKQVWKCLPIAETGTMRKKLNDLEIQAAAYLKSLAHTQKEIATFLGLSESSVSRLLNEARAGGYLKEAVPEFDRTKISESIMRDIQARIAPKKLAEALGKFQIKHDLPFIPDVRIFPASHAGSSKEVFVLRSKDFGRSAAGYATELLLRSRGCVGVSWGTTIANLVTGISFYCRRGARERKPIMFLPLCGEPLGSTGTTNCSASTLATNLDDILNGGSTRTFSLAAVPALIPRSFTAKEVSIIKKLIGHVEAYKEIFERTTATTVREEPLINKVDTILTSVGAAETTLAWGDDELGRTAGFNRSDLKELIIGDISGVLIPKTNLRKTDQTTLIDIQQRWTGVREDQLRDCANRAKRLKTPGVIVSTIGRNKAAIVVECVARGLINQLLIDQDLADELVRLLG